MAVKMEHLPLEVAHLDNFKNYIPGFSQLCTNTVHTLTSLGGLQVSTLFEHALANAGGHNVVSLNKGDLEKNGLFSDAKLSTVRETRFKQQYSAPVSGIFNKVGTLRVQVYERKQHKFYYFAIPYDAYKHIPKTSNIEISFFLDGTPRRIPSRAVMVNWWDYEVIDFATMANRL